MENQIPDLMLSEAHGTTRKMRGSCIIRDALQAPGERKSGFFYSNRNMGKADRVRHKKGGVVSKEGGIPDEPEWEIKKETGHLRMGGDDIQEHLKKDGAGDLKDLPF